MAKEKRYYYKHKEKECLEICQHPDYRGQDVYIGSIGCQQVCDNCIGDGIDESGNYIICKVITKATGKE
jgi:hypothetical protein